MRILGEAWQMVAGLDWRAFFDILLSTVIIYYVIKVIRGTRAVQLAWGLVLLFLTARLADWWGFRTLGLLLGAVTSPGATVAIVILFLPELRHALEEVGRGRFLAVRAWMLRREDVGLVVDELVDTATQLSNSRIGALIVLERNDGLEDIIATGTPLRAVISPRLLLSIFYPGTPLHDGAVVVRGNEVVAAACVLPLSDNTRISSSLHTRHRAALGLAERTDAAVIVVSEETGNISLAYDGRLLTALRPEVVRDKLLGLLQREESASGGRSGGNGRARRKAAAGGSGEAQAAQKAAEWAGLPAGAPAGGKPSLWHRGWRVCAAAPRAVASLIRRAASLGGRFRGEPTD